MIKKIIHRFIRRRHFWRDAGFDELSELYIAVLFRGLSLSLSGIFVPIYMLQLGYGLAAACMLVTWFFVVRAVCDFLAGFTVARYGPKHTLVLGYGLQILSSVLFIWLKDTPLPLWLVGGMWGAAASFFFVPFHVSFSKVKHSRHGGKELSYVNIMEKTGAALGPVVGGVVATVFGAQYMFMLSVLLLLLGLIPLFTSAEPVKTRQKLDFRGLDIAPIKRHFISYGFLGIENTLSLFWWPLFLGSFVLLGNAAYAKFGLLLSVSFIISVAATRIYGKLIDDRRGRDLLRVSAAGNALLHLVRPFISTYSSAFTVNIANEILTPGYRMPYMKGLYDAADDLPGHRIVFFSCLESFACVVKATLWLGLAIMGSGLPARPVFAAGFLIAAAASGLVMIERFRALRPKRPYNEAVQHAQA